MTLGTYKIEDPQGVEVRILISGQRLIHARVSDASRKQLWNSSRIQGILRRKGMQIDESSREVERLFGEIANETVAYNELATTKESEWIRMEQSGDVPNQVGEEEWMQTAQEQLDAAIHEVECDSTKSTSPQALPPPTIPNNSLPISTEIESPQTAPDNINEFLPMDTNEDEIIVPPSDIEMLETKLPTDISPARSETRQWSSIWQREQDIATRDRERTDTQYGLRQRPAKRVYEDISR